MLDVLTLSPFITYPNVYLTCRRTYALWPAARDTAIHAMILSHQLGDHPDKPAFSPCWGDVELYMTATSYRYTTCGKCHFNKQRTSCSSRACRVYKTVITVFNCRNVSSCIKRDIINNITFRFIGSSVYRKKVLSQLRTKVFKAHKPCKISVEADGKCMYGAMINNSISQHGTGHELLISRILDYMWSSAVDSVAYLGADFWSLV